MPMSEVTLFKEHDMGSDQRPMMLKINDIILALDAAGIIKAVKPVKGKDIVCDGSETKNINAGL